MYGNSKEEFAASRAQRIDDRGGVHPERDEEREEHLKVAVFGGHRGDDRAKAQGKPGKHQNDEREKEGVPGKVCGAAGIEEEVKNVNDNEESELDS